MNIIFDYNRTIFDPERGGLFPGIFELLEIMSMQHSLFLVSRIENGRSELIDELGIKPFFKKIIFTDIKTKQTFKPMVTDCPGNTIVIGDRIAEEISIGNSMSLITIWFKNGRFANELPKQSVDFPSYTVENISELRSLLILLSLG